MLLFDSVPRHDASTRTHRESTFAFLNRVDDVYFAGVRETLETWFTQVPEIDQPGLRARLRSKREVQSAAAFWELYLHEILRRSGFDLTHEPSTRSGHRPDYLAVREDATFYLEAKLVGAPKQRQARRDQVHGITDELEKIESGDFRLYFDIRRHGGNPPALRPVRSVVEEWLAGLSHARVLEDALAKRPLPEKIVACADWRFWFRAIPRSPQSLGKAFRSGAIAIGPMMSAGGSSVKRLRTSLEKKAHRYGDLGRPFVVALCCDDIFVDIEDIVSALYGEPSFVFSEDGSATPVRLPTGLWSGNDHARVSAVLTIRTLTTWRINEAVPVLWKNSNARSPLDCEIEWAATGRLAEDGTIVADDAKVHPAEVLGLAAGWPGLEKPFQTRSSARRT